MPQQQIPIPNPEDVEADSGVVLAITRSQLAAAQSNAAFWQAAHAGLLAKHNQVVAALEQRILEATQTPPPPPPDAPDGGDPAQ